MTKQPPIDDGFPKYHMPLEEAHKLIETNVKIIKNSSSLRAYSTNTNHLTSFAVEPSIAKRRSSRTRISGVRTRLGRIMHKLYDLEPECVPERPLKVDLGVDLYQMEDY